MKRQPHLNPLKESQIRLTLPLNQIIRGDCIEVLQGFPENSVDLVVTDPPYGLGFMGKEWDKALPPKEAFVEMFRVLKPGGLAFVMSSPRQDLFCRMGVLLEDAGFELSQSFISWIYKTGFPKAYDVSKGIDKRNNRHEQYYAFGDYLKEKRADKGLSKKDIDNELGTNTAYSHYEGRNKNNKRVVNPPSKENYVKLKSILGLDNRFDLFIDRIIAERNKIGEGKTYSESWFGGKTWDVTEPKLEDAKVWEGWKAQTGLKPALEPIFMVNKPFSESTIVDNVLRWGTGAINIDACRIPLNGERQPIGSAKRVFKSNKFTDEPIYGENTTTPIEGRFPANLLVSDDALDDGEITKSGKYSPHHVFSKDKNGDVPANVYGKYQRLSPEQYPNYADEGSKSRYFDLDAWAVHRGFLDVAKPDTSERNFGLGKLNAKNESVGIRYRISETVLVRKNPPKKEDIANYLKTWRKKRGLTQKEIDFSMGWNTKYSWLEGRKTGIQLTSPENWIKLKTILLFDNKFDKQMMELITTKRANPTFKETLPRRNIHPTVKPIKLMAYLIELGCPKNGVVLDPFVGSGTTCIAAKRLCRRYIGIELSEEYHALAVSRVAAYPQPLEWFGENVLKRESKEDADN